MRSNQLSYPASRELRLNTIRDYIAHMNFRRALALRSANASLVYAPRETMRSVCFFEKRVQKYCFFLTYANNFAFFLKNLAYLAELLYFCRRKRRRQ